MQHLHEVPTCAIHNEAFIVKTTRHACSAHRTFRVLSPTRFPGSFITVNLFRDDGVSSTPPESPLSPTKATSARFIFDVPNSLDPLPFECNLDAAGWVDCISPLQFPGPLADGPHALEVRVAGNPATRHEWNIGK